MPGLVTSVAHIQRLPRLLVGEVELTHVPLDLCLTDACN